MLIILKKVAIIYGSAAVLLYGAEFLTGASSPAGAVNDYLNICQSDAQVSIATATGAAPSVFPRP